MRDEQIRLWWDDTPIDLFFMNIPLHQAMNEHKQPRTFDGIPTFIISVTYLVTCKIIFNRFKDWADIETVLEHPDLNTNEVTKWVSDICGNGSESFKRWSKISRSKVKISPEEFQMLSIKQVEKQS
ncbi:MAG: hypothetical protein M1483_00715 [Actinobacteria bacterium]|nr:hypothetical protein [Actinomycetota bacterium]MCL6104156.1 hypothetical protein [Actinomycetota bacterium]